MSNEGGPDRLSPIEEYLQVAAEVLALDGYKVIGQLSIGGSTYVDGKNYVSVYFTDERQGLMMCHIPAPQQGSGEI